MQNGTVPSEFLPYFLALNPATGTVPKNTNQNLTITGTIRKSDFQDASAGTYADTVVLSILP
jgi:spore coat protein U-like protein